MHNFALRLLVPETLYEQVNQYVHKTNLRGRIIYHKVRKQDYIDSFLPNSNASLFYKFEFQPKSAYLSWVTHAIRTDYDYICTDNLQEFQQCKKAITSSGLIKSNERHEKDDRENILHRDNYVLGWDTKEKIKWWQQTLKQIDLQIKDKRKELKQEEDVKKVKEQINKSITQLRTYRQYEEIDKESITTELQGLYDDKRRLENTNNRIQELQTQRLEIEKKISHFEKEKETRISEKALIENAIIEWENSLCRENEYLQSKDSLGDFHKKYQIFEEKLANSLSKIDLKNVEQQQTKVFQDINKIIQGIEKEINEKDKMLLGLIKDFKQPNETITLLYKDWRSDTYNIPEDTKSVDEYLRILEKLEGDDLPNYKKKFENFLSEKMIHKIGEFGETLNDWLDNIEENIDMLNQALQRINFKNNPETYIQLKSEIRKNENVKMFRSMLADAALPEVHAWSSHENLAHKEAHFREKIVPFIRKVADNDCWREEVIDVRNWQSFYAAEFYRETNKPMREYREMGTLSGGEKAQLTYTILGSALAYQFGITMQGKEARSFRFIAVDESFSNQDDEKATYLMDLCKQLHLQLLVVTPSDKIHIVEPYISYVHYVQRRNNRDSVLVDMPILQFQQQRNNFMSEQVEQV